MLSLIGLAAPSVNAIERLGYIGQSFSAPLFVRNPNSYDELTYHLDMGYFLQEKVAVNLSIDTQVDGLQLFYLEFGPEFYPVQDTLITPFASARLLYTMVPNGTAGWLANLGIESQLSRNHEAENFRLRISTGAGQFLFDGDNVLFIELIRVGLVWAF